MNNETHNDNYENIYYVTGYYSDEKKINRKKRISFKVDLEEISEEIENYKLNKNYKISTKN
jgi:hypothetical protein